jgi:hypothetical protein
MRFLTLTSLFVALMVGCKDTPDPNDLVRSMVVQTVKDGNTAYDFYTTFTLSLDTIGYYANTGDPDDTLWFDSDPNSFPSIVTHRIQDEMAAAGYTYVLKEEEPDLGIAATIYFDYNVYQQINYPSYYSSYYGFGYGGYYGPIVSTYEYSSTTLVIHLIDLKTPYPEGRKVIWKAYIGDITQSNNPSQKTLEAITQAFKQSPYISKP